MNYMKKKTMSQAQVVMRLSQFSGSSVLKKYLLKCRVALVNFCLEYFNFYSFKNYLFEQFFSINKVIHSNNKFIHTF
jgi:hypothetical protein